MHSLTIGLPEFRLVLDLFEIGRLSSGKAADLCGMSRADFLASASRAGVPVAVLDDADLAAEFRAA